jgi:hypothetical protein
VVAVYEMGVLPCETAATRVDFRGVAVISTPDATLDQFREVAEPYFKIRTDYGFPGYVRKVDVQRAASVVAKISETDVTVRKCIDDVRGRLDGEEVFQLSGGEKLLDGGADPRVVVACYLAHFELAGRVVMEMGEKGRAVDHIYPEPGDISRTSVTTTVRQKFHTDVAGTGSPDEVLSHNVLIPLANSFNVPTLFMPVEGILAKMAAICGKADADKYISGLQCSNFYTPDGVYGPSPSYPILSTALGYPELFYIEDGASRSFTREGEQSRKALNKAIKAMARDQEYSEVKQSAGHCSVVSETRVLHAGAGLPPEVQKSDDLGMHTRLVVRAKLLDPSVEERKEARYRFT